MQFAAAAIGDWIGGGDIEHYPATLRNPDGISIGRRRAEVRRGRLQESLPNYTKLMYVEFGFAYGECLVGFEKVTM